MLAVRNKEPQQGLPGLTNVRAVITKSTSVLQTAKKMSWLSTTTKFGFGPVELIVSAASGCSASLGAPHRGEWLQGNEAVHNQGVNRCENVLFSCCETFDFIKDGS